MQVIELSKRVLGEEHPSTLTSIANLAFTFKSQSRSKEEWIGADLYCLLVIYACMSARPEENKAAADREFLTQRLPFEIFFSLQICRCRSGTVHFQEQHSQPDTCTSRKTSPYCTPPFRHQLQHDTRTLNRSLTASTGWHK